VVHVRRDGSPVPMLESTAAAGAEVLSGQFTSNYLRAIARRLFAWLFLTNTLRGDTRRV